MRIMTIKFSLCYSFEPETKDIRDEKEEKVRLCVCVPLCLALYLSPRGLAGPAGRRAGSPHSRVRAWMCVRLQQVGGKVNKSSNWLPDRSVLCVCVRSSVKSAAVYSERRGSCTFIAAVFMSTFRPSTTDGFDLVEG